MIKLPARRIDRSKPPAGRPARWPALAGMVLGLGVVLLSQLPAAWLASAVHTATEGRFQLAEAEGTLWNGSALPVLTGGPGSRDAALLPSRLSWQLRPVWFGLSLAVSQPCCMAQAVALRWEPGWNSTRISVLPQGELIGVWSAALLEGLGAPFNTLKPGGQLRLSSKALSLHSTGGAWRLSGEAELQLLQTSSRLSTVSPLGSYRITLTGLDQQPSAIALRTLDGALQLQGQGELRPRGLYFRGHARAAPGQEPALNNLLNIIGRRQGASSVISIG